MTERISAISDFILQLDRLKSVNRRTYINGGERVENSAEHSWHLAMACWAFAELLQDDYDVPKLIKLALIHDLGEIGAGDTFLYSSNRENAHFKERESVKQTDLTSGKSNYRCGRSLGGAGNWSKQGVKTAESYRPFVTISSQHHQ
jgi:Predicted hydrolases of HD superfamily